MREPAGIPLRYVDVSNPCAKAENEIKPILFEVFSETRVDVEAMIETYHEMFLSLDDDDETVKQIEE